MIALLDFCGVVFIWSVLFWLLDKLYDKVCLIALDGFYKLKDLFS